MKVCRTALILKIAASVFWCLLLIPKLVAAGERESGDSFVDDLELQLELFRHELLVKTKKASQAKLVDFTTDGCSGGLSGGWEFLAERIKTFKDIHGTLPPWQECCVEHDRAYHVAGQRDDDARQSFVGRRNADEELRHCVIKTGRERRSQLAEAYQLAEPEVDLLYEAIAAVMYRSVRLGGVPCSGLPWRWGYGWPPCQKQKTLSAE